MENASRIYLLTIRKPKADLILKGITEIPYTAKLLLSRHQLSEP